MSAQAQQVFIGIADQWGDLTATPEKWRFVRENADGLYLNFIMMKRLKPGMLEATARLMQHHAAFLESDVRVPKGGRDDNGATAEDDRAAVRALHTAGFGIAFTSLNYGWNDERAGNLLGADLRPDEQRHNLVQLGPWTIGGDLVSDGPEARRNHDYRRWIDAADGVLTDGPMGLWKADRGHMRAGSVSAVHYAHKRGKLAAVMLGPYGAGEPGYDPSQFLTVAQGAVRRHEDENAIPDVWAVFEYATAIPAVPEQERGRAVSTTTGIAFWLLHHLRDPCHKLRLTMAAEGWRKAEDGTEYIEAVLSNESEWLDFAPHLRVSGPEGLHTLLNGTEITAAVTAEGAVLSGPMRLWPGRTWTLRLVLDARRSRNSEDRSLVHLSVAPARAMPAIVDQFTVHSTLTKP